MRRIPVRPPVAAGRILAQRRCPRKRRYRPDCSASHGASAGVTGQRYRGKHPFQALPPIDPSGSDSDVVQHFRDALVGADTARCLTTRCLGSVRALWGDSVRQNVSEARVTVSGGSSEGWLSVRRTLRSRTSCQMWGATCWVCAAVALALSGWSRMPSSIAGCAGRGRRLQCGWLRLSWRGFA